VRVVISRVDTPLVASVGVGGVADTVRDCVTHARVRVLHIHLHAECALSLFESALAHFCKVAKIFLH
jgi:hypothetical protein